jgi:8-oxo-dGTP pyrophosphatase MutT (NUDIX family)
VRERIRSRLVGTREARDPAKAALAALTPELARAFGALRLTPAAVLVPVIERTAGISLLLTQRTEHLRDHAGQISFPGGRVEPGDANALETALRESNEEVGLSAEAVQVVGYMPPRPVVTGFVVTPVVGMVEPDLAHVADPHEVAEVFEVPLEFLRESKNRVDTVRAWGGLELPVCEYHYQGRRIWGATAQILDEFIRLLNL